MMSGQRIRIIFNFRAEIHGTEINEVKW